MKLEEILILDLNSQLYEPHFQSEFNNAFKSFSERAAVLDKVISIFENTNKIMEDLFTDINFGLRLNTNYKGNEEIKKDALKTIRKIREYSHNRKLLAKSLDWIEDVRKKVLVLVKQNKECFKTKDSACDLQQISVSIDERLQSEIITSYDNGNDDKISKSLLNLKKFEVFEPSLGSNNINEVFYADLSMIEAYLNICLKDFKDYTVQMLLLMANEDFNLFNVS